MGFMVKCSCGNKNKTDSSSTTHSQAAIKLFEILVLNRTSWRSIAISLIQLYGIECQQEVYGIKCHAFELLFNRFDSISTKNLHSIWNDTDFAVKGMWMWKSSFGHGSQMNKISRIHIILLLFIHNNANEFIVYAVISIRKKEREKEKYLLE